ncbi:transposase [Micromonospora sp. CPCC 206060]|uniref:transposase n=1 Tax=Micromonospora sp. CPCC 206060 TaxID=3122406 RepID=UPI002FF203A0
MRRQSDPEFRAGAVRIVRETGKSIAQVARDLGINSGTLANWVKRDRENRGEAAAGQLAEDERAEPGPAAAGERFTVLKRSVVLWVKEATSR